MPISFVFSFHWVIVAASLCSGALPELFLLRDEYYYCDLLVCHLTALLSFIFLSFIFPSFSFLSPSTSPIFFLFFYLDGLYSAIYEVSAVD